MRRIAVALALILSAASKVAAQQSLDLYTSSLLAAMVGQSETALRAARAAAESVRPQLVRSTARLEVISAAPYSTLVTFGRWDEVLAEPLPAPELRFTTAMAYYARGVAFAAKRRWAEAGAALDTISAAARGLSEGDTKTALEIAVNALAGEIALRRERPAAAVQRFQAAVALEDRLAKRHPRAWYYPMRQSLGKSLLAAGRAAEAERVYRQNLARFPENGWSLYGLSQALEAQGRTQEAAAVRDRFQAVWRLADVRLEASRF